MKEKAKVRVNSFWGDLANALLLSPVYREPAQSAQQAQPIEPKERKCNCDCNEPK